MSSSGAGAAPAAGASPSTPTSRADPTPAAYRPYLAPTWSLQVNTAMHGKGDPVAALDHLQRLGMNSGLKRDWTYKSPIAPSGGLNRYEKPTYRRQRIERKGAWEYKQRQLLTILRVVLFKKNR